MTAILLRRLCRSQQSCSFDTRGFDLQVASLKFWSVGRRIQRNSAVQILLRQMATETESKDVRFSVIKEGKAETLQPVSVFYNPVQEFNRDLTIAVISEFVKEHFNEVHEKKKKRLQQRNGNQELKSESTSGDNDVEMTADNGDAGQEESKELEAGIVYEDGIKVLEALAATGLRSMRFGLEIPGVKSIITNDFDANAVEVIKENVKRNSLGHIVSESHSDAALLMYQNKGFKDRFDVIDLDPYGSAAPFLDSAVQAVRDRGLLCVTCTDTAILCGNASETCYAKYGAVSSRAKYHHEMSLRIVLQSIESHAIRYGRYIVPLLSISVDFYVRVFVKVYSSAAKAKHALSKLSLVYNCVGCGAFSLQRMGGREEHKPGQFKFPLATGPPVSSRCEHCSHRHHLSGPIYNAPIHDFDFVQRVLQSVTVDRERFKTVDRIEGLLSVVTEELPDVPLYYVIDDVCNIVHTSPPSMVKFRSAFLNAGYRVSQSHAEKNAVKTDAPASVLWDIIRSWVKKHPVSEKRLTTNSPAKTILEKEPAIEVSFNPHPRANPESRSKKLKRWCPNPEKFWGPKPRARKDEDSETLQQRREKNQGKRKRKDLKEKEVEEREENNAKKPELDPDQTPSSTGDS